MENIARRSKKYSKREGLSLGTRTIRTIDLPNARDSLLDDDKEKYDEIFICYYYHNKSIIQKRKDFKAKSFWASFAALLAGEAMIRNTYARVRLSSFYR